MGVEYNFLLQGDIPSALREVMTNYPVAQWGILWIAVGFLLFAVLYEKKGTLAVPGVVLSLYLAIVSAFMAPAVWIIFAIVIAIIITAMSVKLIKE